MSRILITAAGVNSPLGCGVDEFNRNLGNGSFGTGHLENFDVRGYPTDFAAEVRENGQVLKTGPEVDRKALFIGRAVAEVVNNSPDLANYLPERRLLHLGAGIDYFNFEDYVNSERSGVGDWHHYYRRSPQVLRRIAEAYGIEGGYSANVSACAASSQAVGLSYRILKRAPGRVVISGGFDSMLCHLHYMGFYKLGALAEGESDARHACRPFDRNRGGLVLGEGAAAFLLQREEDVQANQPLAEICGYGSTVDAYKVTDPDPEGRQLASAARAAIEEAGLEPEDIDCVHLHGTGTYKNALAETAAMASVFGSRYKTIPVFSLKAQVGHLIGACGALEILAVIYSLQNQIVPPTLNHQTPDPEVPLRIITTQPLAMPLTHILKLNSGFGGQNTAILIKRFP